MTDKMNTKKHTSIREFDTALIGDTPEIFERALKLARGGVHTALVLSQDQSSIMPRDSIILSALRASAATAQYFRSAEKFGILSVKPDIGWHSVKIHIHDILERIEPQYSLERLRGLGVEIFTGIPEMLGNDTLVLPDQTHIKADTIECGMDVYKPPVLPACLNKINPAQLLSLSGIADWGELPETLSIIGGGAIAVELAQSLTRLGCKTALISSGEILPGIDQELYKILYERLEFEGVRLLSHANITAAEEDDKKGVTLHMNHNEATRRLTSSKLLVMPEDTQKHSPQNLRVVHSDPCIAEIGLNESQARAKLGAGNFHLVKWRYQESNLAQSRRRIDGLVKITASPNGTVIGASICGENAAELISLWSLAITRNLKIQDMKEIEIPHSAYSAMNLQSIKGYIDQIASPLYAQKPAPLWHRLLKKS